MQQMFKPFSAPSSLGSVKKREKQLTLRFSCNLHIKSGQKMLRDMNIKIDFIEKRDNNMKLKFLLQPYQEENPWDSLPESQV